MKAAFPEPESAIRKPKRPRLRSAVRQDLAVALTKRKDTGLPVSAGRRPITAAEVDRLLAHLP